MKLLALALILAATTPFVAGARKPAGRRRADPAQAGHGRQALRLCDNLEMTETESRAFWPIYDEYEAKVKKLDDRFLNLVNNYAAKYDTLTDAEATAGSRKRWRSRASAALKQKYTRRLRRSSPKKALRYAQLETRIENIVRRQVYSLIPLAH